MSGKPLYSHVLCNAQCYTRLWSSHRIGWKLNYNSDWRYKNIYIGMYSQPFTNLHVICLWFPHVPRILGRPAAPSTMGDNHRHSYVSRKHPLLLCHLQQNWLQRTLSTALTGWAEKGLILSIYKINTFVWVIDIFFNAHNRFRFDALTLHEVMCEVP